MFFRLFFSLIFILNLSLISGCGSELSDVLGTNKLPPDEFTILTKPPLIVPPEYNLRPPAEGEIRPNVQQPNRQLQSILFGQNKTDDFSSSEISLMTGSDVAEAIPNIKEVLDSEMRDVEVVSPNLESQVLNSTSEVLK
jgi:hypothetical protein|tara:strand:+ start:113 stop:529 length:417 start_codon:yes stop_codon:yes gene_type:complete